MTVTLIAFQPVSYAVFLKYTRRDSITDGRTRESSEQGENVGTPVGTSVALQAWAATINGDERLQELVAIATALDDEQLESLLAVGRGMMSASKAVRS